MAHILIVEDEEHIAQMIEATLSLGGYSCEICSDGAQAVERIFAGGFDLVLLDVMLPGLDGFSVMARVASQGTPVIFLSAMQQVADKVRGLHLGAEDYIAKPFEALELLAMWRWPCAAGAKAGRCWNTGASARIFPATR